MTRANEPLDPAEECRSWGTRSRGWRRLLVACLAVVATAAPSGAARQPYTIDPRPPAWVTAVEAPPDHDAEPSAQSSDIRFLLVDSQVQVGSDRVEEFEHLARSIVTKAGLRPASQLSIELDPSYQRLILHYVRVLRGGKAIDALRRNEIRVLQREEELERQVFDGSVTVVAVLHDLREGDVVEHAYTLVGQNPVLGGRYVASFDIGYGVPVGLRRQRLLVPRERRFEFRGRGTDATAVARDVGTQREYLWSFTDLAPIELQSSVPAWYPAFPEIEVSEFGSWAEVVEWGLPLYQRGSPLPAELALQIDEWRQLAGPAQVRAALEFVQDDVRYLGIEIGPHSHYPHDPAEVFARRFGDCKDKSRLLIAILDALGIEARPVLVNTMLEAELASRLPSPYAFNHVIVRTAFDGADYWLDTTRSYERGPLDQRTLTFARGLVIAPGESDLQPIPVQAPPGPGTAVTERYTVDPDWAGARLDVTTRYVGTSADGMRQRIKSSSPSELQQSYLEFYADTDPDVVSVAPPAVDDDPAANVVTVRESYRIGRFWSNGVRDLWAWSVGDHLTTTPTAARTMPLSLPFPLHVTHRFEVELPSGPGVDARADSLVQSDRFGLRYLVEPVGNLLRVDYDLTLRADHVEAAEVAGHVLKVEEGRDLLSYRLVKPEGEPGTGVSAIVSNSSRETVLAWMALLGLGGGVAFLVQRQRWRRREQPPRRRPRFPVGESPRTAIPVSNWGDSPSHLVGLRCGCAARSHLSVVDALPSEVRYLDGLLHVYELQCDGCGASSARYFALS